MTTTVARPVTNGLTVGQRVSQDLDRGERIGVAETEELAAPLHALERRGTTQLEHPAGIDGGDEVDRASHRPRPQDPAIEGRLVHRGGIHRCRPRSDRPLSAPQLLGLQGTEVGDDLLSRRVGF